MQQENDVDYRRLMTKMVDVIAHDVRNPLNNILLSTAQFKTEALPDKEDTAFYIDIIERNCDRVNSLLEEIINIIHQPGLNPDVFDITEVMKELVQENEERLELKDMKFQTSLNEVVIARFDREMLKKALLQLMDNAIEASAKDGVISLKVYEEGDRAVIIISDQGEGIAADIKPYVFAPFYTTKERNRGLGLTLARNVIEAHVGEIKFADVEQGTEVRLSIPKNA
jgi:signal transduction histidine kinase